MAEISREVVYQLEERRNGHTVSLIRERVEWDEEEVGVFFMEFIEVDGDTVASWSGKALRNLYDSLNEMEIVHRTINKVVSK